MTDQPIPAEGPALSDAAPEKRRIPLIAKVYGVLCILSSTAVLTIAAVIAVGFVWAFVHGGVDIDIQTSAANIIIFAAQMALFVALFVLLLVLGINLLRNRRRGAAQTAEAAAFVTTGVIACDIMLNGISEVGIPILVILVVSIVLASWLDPSLIQERELQRKLRDMEAREQAEEGTLGLDETGKGYITLNFFNLFWIFVVASIIGLVLETIYHFAVVDPGHYQDRAGLLFGPFSPIYGVGAVLMTMALNRFHKAPLAVVFLVSAVIGGLFEFLASWFFQFAFGILAWDYTGSTLFGLCPDPIAILFQGRTSALFMCMWGVLGVAWIRLLLPWMLHLVNLIPWNWRYTLTAVCAALMVADCVMTLLSFDCWYERMAGNAPESAMEQFMARNFDNAYMAERFQSMSLNPEDATRNALP
ncbi:MAG TPA: putative ABC transporter permease [Candidatus Aphodovivens avicola]|nr:putative ABC transporter permease [Candidatus Aphodovivens avicola]